MMVWMIWEVMEIIWEEEVDGGEMMGIAEVAAVGGVLTNGEHPVVVQGQEAQASIGIAVDFNVERTWHQQRLVDAAVAVEAGDVEAEEVSVRLRKKRKRFPYRQATDALLTLRVPSVAATLTRGLDSKQVTCLEPTFVRCDLLN